ncbi:serine/threonine protein kinase, partial [Mycobacterium colombiense]
AGVLGALAIIIAVLIVINSRADQQQQPPTVTDTGTPPASAPASKTPSGSGAQPGMRLNWPDDGTIGTSGFTNVPARHGTPQ